LATDNIKREKKLMQKIKYLYRVGLKNKIDKFYETQKQTDNFYFKTKTYKFWQSDIGEIFVDKSTVCITGSFRPHHIQHIHISRDGKRFVDGFVRFLSYNDLLAIYGFLKETIIASA
jgi:hypothetical protein